MSDFARRTLTFLVDGGSIEPPRALEDGESKAGTIEKLLSFDSRRVVRVAKPMDGVIVQVFGSPWGYYSLHTRRLQ